MAIELEIKARVESHAAIRKRLRSEKARFVQRVFETNLHFDTAERHLFKKGSGLRVRMVRDLTSRHKELSATITFKGPLKKGPYKSRDEFETDVADVQEMVRLLGALGLVERIRFEKIRESWELKVGGGRKCKVELDEIPMLGRFVEIEAANAHTIRLALRLLGLQALEPIRQSYVGMLSAARKTRGGSTRPLIFKFE